MFGAVVFTEACVLPRNDACLRPQTFVPQPMRAAAMALDARGPSPIQTDTLGACVRACVRACVCVCACVIVLRVRWKLLELFGLMPTCERSISRPHACHVGGVTWLWAQVRCRHLACPGTATRSTACAGACLFWTPTALAACCGFDLCHKYILYFVFCIIFLVPYALSP